VIWRKLRAWLGITSPAQRLREQADRELRIDLDAFGAGYLQAQRAASGMTPLDRAAEDERLKAVAARYINRLYEISNPSIGKRRNA
jgi:hypothetical protein